MVKKTLIVTSILFLSYTLFVSFLAPKWWKGIGNDIQTRSTKVENFLYNTNISNKNIILGTSLANRIIMDSIKNTYNLSLSSLGVFDGLYILSLKKEMPKFLFIEMNYFTKEPNESFTNKFSNPTLFIKKHIISLQEDKQPLVIFGNLLSEKCFKPSKSSKALMKKNKNDSLKDLTILNELLSRQKDIYNVIPSDSILASSLDKLEQILKEYQLKGTKIVFFEVPVNYTLINSPYSIAIRNCFYKKFPKSAYKYIDLPENIKFISSDGLHLSSDEAKIYSSYFAKQTSML